MLWDGDAGPLHVIGNAYWSSLKKKKVGKVVGVELWAPAIEDAKRNASDNGRRPSSLFTLGITNVEYHAGKAEDFLPSYMQTIPQGTAVIGIVDPPRGGLREYSSSGIP